MPIFSGFRRGWLLRLALAPGLLAGCRADNPGPPPVARANVSPLPALAPADAVLYEVFVADFSQAGTFDGLLARLDSVRATGANALWLMPVFPTHGSPYAVDSYATLNPDFGDLAAFDRLVTAAHQRGLRVLLDWVANHTSYYHPWLQQHPTWYVRDAQGQPVPPHPAWTDVAQLDFGEPAMRQAMVAAMRSWVTDHAIDGFRCDAADLVPDAFWQEALPALRTANPSLLLLAEGSRPAHYGSGFALTFGWDFYATLGQVMAGAPATGLAAAHLRELQAVPPGRYRLRFTTNHDEMLRGDPAATLGGEAAARAAYAATLAFGATPLLYNGQEAGDPAQPAHPVRTPIRWGLDRSAGRFYRGLLGSYQALPAWRNGPAEPADAGPDAVAVRHRLGSQEVAVLVNVRPRPATLTLPATWQGAPAWTDAYTRQAVGTALTLTLPAYGFAVWTR